MCGHEVGSAQHNSLSWLLDPAPLARDLLLRKRLARDVARATTAAYTACFFLSAASLAIMVDRAVYSACVAALLVRGWTSRLVPIHQLELRFHQLESPTGSTTAGL